MHYYFTGMAPLCSSYDAYFRNLAEKQDSGAGEDWNGTVDLVLADALYNVWRDRNDDHALYDMFCLNDIKERAEVLVVVMNPGARGHVFRSAR